MRGVACGGTERVVVLRFIFDGPIQDEDREAMSVVAAEVAADLPHHMAVEEEILRADPEQDLLSYGLGDWAYMRKE